MDPEIEEMDMDNEDFKIICKKCGSNNVVFEADDTWDVEEIFLSPNVILKCKDCGNQICVY